MKYYKFAAFLGLLSVSINSFGDESNLSFNDYYFTDDQAFTPARMDQSIRDTPGAVTIISGKKINELGIKTIPDIMKLVPGFNVAYFSGISTVNRGNTTPTPRRLQVLVDGISQIDKLVGVVYWDILPVPIENIARVEVIRSQASASYGANSFLGAINIITRHPIDRLGAEVEIYASERGGNGYAGYAGQIGNTSASFDVKNYRYDRYDSRVYSDEPKNDDVELEEFSAKSVTKMDNGDSLLFSVSGARGNAEADATQTIFGINYPVIEHTLLNGKMEYHFNSKNHTTAFSMAITDTDQNWHWDVCAPKGVFNPELGRSFYEYINSGIYLEERQFGSIPKLVELGQVFVRLLLDPTSYETVCGNTQMDYHNRSYQTELADIWEINDYLRLSSALQFNTRTIDSLMYGGGKTTLEKSEFFTNMEYRIGDMMTINSGVFVESLGYNFSKPQFSPRLGFNFHLTPHSTVKFVVSRGKRLIDGIELIEEIKTPTHFPYEVYGSTTQYAFFTNGYSYKNRNHVEEIDSVELIYYFKNRTFELESRIYNERLQNIYNAESLFALPGVEWAGVFREGFEIAATKSVLDYKFNLSTYLIDSHSDGITFDQYSYYGGSAYIIRYFPRDIIGSIAYYGRSKYYYGTETAKSQASERLYNESGRFDLRLSKSFSFDDTDLGLQLLYSHHVDGYESPTGFIYVEESGKRTNKNEVTLGISLQF